MSRPPKPKSPPETTNAEPAPRRQPPRGKSGSTLRGRLVEVKASALRLAERNQALEAALQAGEERIAALEASLTETIRSSGDLHKRIARSRAETLAAEEEANLLRAVIVDTAISNHANGSAFRAAAKSRAIASAGFPSITDCTDGDAAFERGRRI